MYNDNFTVFSLDSRTRSRHFNYRSKAVTIIIVIVKSTVGVAGISEELLRHNLVMYATNFDCLKGQNKNCIQ